MRTLLPLGGLLTFGLLISPPSLMAQDAEACWLRGATPAEAAERPSPLGVVAIPMGDAEATLCYGRPSAKGRTVMGGLVPFGEAWRTGANEATAIHLPFAATIGDVELEPGSYSIYTVPGESEWVITVSPTFDRWGIPITADIQAAALGSFTRPAALTDEMVETLTFTWQSHGEMMGHVVMEWENTRVEFPIHMAGMNH